MSGQMLIGALAMLSVLTALLLGLATISGRGFLPGLWFGMLFGFGVAVVASWSGFSLRVLA